VCLYLSSPPDPRSEYTTPTPLTHWDPTIPRSFNCKIPFHNQINWFKAHKHASKFVLLFLAPLGIATVEFGVLVPKQNHARSIPTMGGWSLQANTCPVGTSTCGAAWCVRTRWHAYDLVTQITQKLAARLVRHLWLWIFYRKLTGGFETACQTSLQASPVCADSSWSLWNTTNVDGAASDGYTGYLCCLLGRLVCRELLILLGKVP